MTPKSPRSPVLLPIRKTYFAALLMFLTAMFVPVAHATTTVTTTTLAISATSVPYKTPIILTATVTAGGAPVSAGFVLFCDATAAFCENNTALGMVQLTSASATAQVKIGSGPLGVHSYKAVYRANNIYATNVSNTVSYSVQGTYSTTTAILSTGSVGNYNLTGNVTGIGSVVAGPGGNISFLDTSAGNNLLGSQPLGPATLSNNFTQAPNSPFPIATSSTTQRSVAIASDYLDGDNNLDVVTGDANHTVTVLLGNGDGTFQPKVNYPGCATGKALKILLADFNRDGNPDIALGCSDNTNGGLVILLGNGDGSFQTPVSYTSGDVAGLAKGDFNGDGILDIAVTDRLQQNVTTFIGNGDGTFQAGVVSLTTPKAAHDVVVADFNQDGNDDLVYAVTTAASSSSLSDLYVALGNGDSTFQAPVLTASKIGEFLTVGDTNADNIPDVVASTITGSTHIGNYLFVLIGKGDGTFKSTVTYVSDIPSDPHLADVNGDGKPDIIAGGSYGALVYLGNGDGTFQAYSEPVIGGFALTYAVNAGDYNNDGNADLIGTDANNPQAAVSLSEVSQGADAAALTGVALFPLGSGTHYVDASYSGDSIYLSSISSTIPLLAAPTPTTLSLAVSPSSATLAGQAVTMTATLSPYTVGPPTTTTDGESIKFFNGATLLGTGTLSNGVATLTTTALPPGNDSLKAVYPGDANYNTSSSSSVSVTVASILLASSPNPSIYGQSVTFTATVPSGETGSVTFKDGPTTLGIGTLSGTTTSFTTFALAAGSHDITAVYSGDGSHSAATSPIVTQVVNKATPTLAVTTSGASTYGDPVTIAASLPAGPTGTVVFTSGSTTLGTGTVNASGIATITTSVLPAGSDPITATYGGDGNYNTATGSTTQTVAKKTSVTTLTSSGNPSVPGAAVTFTDSLPTGLTGTVTFTSGATVLGTSPVAGGTATATTSALPLGSNPITATYNGDANNNTSVATLTQVVAKTTPVVTVATSGPSVYGASVAITVSLSMSATGTVTITSGGVTLGTGSASGTITITTTALPMGSDLITASYPGDATNNPATGTTTQSVSKASPALALASSVNPSTVNQAVTFTATLPANATGTVTFTSGATALGTATIVNGVATVTTSALPTGSDPITANYSGDDNNNTSSASLTQTVLKANPTVTVTTSGPSTYGGAVTITATVPTGVTGTVTITSGGVTLGAGTINAGVVTVTTTTLPAGNDTIMATYGGDSNNNTATGTTVQVVAKATPAGTVTSSVNPSTPGASVTFTDTLPTGVTGTVTFTSGATTLGIATIANGVATVTTSALPVGNDSIAATYNGDSNYNTSTATMTQTVEKITPTVTVTTSGPSIYGSSVTITASLPAGTTGTVAFTSGGTALGTATVIPAGTAAIATTILPVGTDTITASYGGDSTNNSATGTTTQTVSKASPSVALVSSANPTTFDQSVTFTATLPTNVTGTVIFTSGTTLGTSPVVNGVATATTSTLPIGSNTITATYGGDGNNNTATASLTQTVNKGTPTVTVTTSGPSTYGGTVTITTTVPPGTTGTVTITSGGVTLGSGPVTPAGTVIITTTELPVGTDTITASYGGDNNNYPATGSTTEIVGKTTPSVTVTTSGPSTYGDPVTITTTVPPGTTGTVTITSGGTTVGTGTISPTGTVTVTTTTLPVGTDPITVSYGGDGNNTSATGTTTQVVSKATPAVTLVSSANPSTVSQSVTFTATVPTTASGTITFLDGSTALGTATVNNGVATITTSTLTAGSHIVTASYSGDANSSSATSAPLTQTVNKETPVLPAPTVSSTNTTVGSPETISETVPPGVTGPVTFYEGSTPIGTAPIVNGVATITVTTLPVGTDPITASTPGDANNNPATSPATVVTVTKTTPMITLASSINPSSTGQSVTFTVTAPAGATGTVTFLDGATVLGSATLTNGQAALTTATLTAGSHTITADYGGDAGYNAASSSPLTQTVNKGTPTLPPPAVSAPTLGFGSSETISETVPSGVTGPVTFYNGSTVIGTAPIVNGVATITITTLPIGTDSITASTPADANNNAATSPATQVTVTKMTPVLPPPTVSTATPTTDTPVTISEQVPPGVTGSITFYDGPTVIGTATIVDGVATITVPSLPLGSNPITAVSSGTDTSNPATSPITPVVVSKVVPVVALTSSVNPAEFNQSVTFTAAVPAAASGTMTFRDGAVVLGAGSVNAAGLASFTTSTLTIGSHTITAAYGGNSNYETATSAPLGQVVGKVPTVVTLTQSGPTQLLHNMVTFSATVAAGSPTPTGTVTFLEGATILGTAALSTNGTVVSFAKSGDAAYATSGLATGSHQIVAIYSGDANFAPSTSAPITNIVQDFTNVVNGVAIQNIFPGDSTSYKFDLAPVGSTTFLNDLNLTISGLPPGTTYTFTPASIAAGSGTTSVVLNIKTSSSLSAQNRLPQGDPTSHRGLPIALGMLGLAGLGVVRKHGRKMPRMLMVLLLCLGSLLPIAALSGCAGGYFTLTPTTYSVSVTGAEGSIQHTATATLVVQ